MQRDVQSPRVRALVAWLAARQREAWEGASLAARRELVRIVFESVQLDVVGREVSVAPAEEFAALMVHRAGYVGNEGSGTPDRTGVAGLPSAGNRLRLEVLGGVR